MGKNTKTIKKKEGALLVAIMEVSSEVNAVRTKYMFMSYDLNAWQNYKTYIANKSPVKVTVKAKILWNGTSWPKLQAWRS